MHEHVESLHIPLPDAFPILRSPNIFSATRSLVLAKFHKPARTNFNRAKEKTENEEATENLVLNAIIALVKVFAIVMYQIVTNVIPRLSSTFYH